MGGKCIAFTLNNVSFRRQVAKSGQKCALRCSTLPLFSSPAMMVCYNYAIRTCLLAKIFHISNVPRQAIYMIIFNKRVDSTIFIDACRSETQFGF